MSTTLTSTLNRNPTDVARPVPDSPVQPSTKDDPANTVAEVDNIETTEQRDVVDEASIQSFPASDPPSWTFGIERK